MNMFSYILKTLLIGLAAATIPSDITFCGKRNPNLNHCVIDSVRETFPKITDGVPEWGIPKIEPLHIPEIEVGHQDTFMAKIRNAVVFGLPKLVVNSIDIQLDKQFLTVESFIPRINITGEYDGVTKILVTLAGKGPVNVVVNNIVARLRVEFDIVPRKSGNFIFLKTVTVVLDIGDFDFHYESYVNPGGPIDEGINTALNSDPKGALQLIKPGIENAVAKITLDIGNKFCKHYTYDQLFADRE